VTVRLERTFRGNDYIYGVTSDVIHEKNLDSGIEIVYKRVGDEWSRTKNAQSLYTIDFVQDRERKALLNDVYSEACAKEGR
jgi:hypothetical protein